MVQPLDPGALLARTYQLPDGPRVRLRYARRSDAPGLRELLSRRGIEAADVSVERLVRFDPTRRAAICATGLIGGAETIVGVGAIDLDTDALPETLVIDERFGGDLAELLAAALLARAAARRVA